MCDISLDARLLSLDNFVKLLIRSENAYKTMKYNSNIASNRYDIMKYTAEAVQTAILITKIKRSINTLKIVIKTENIDWNEEEWNIRYNISI